MRLRFPNVEHPCAKLWAQPVAATFPETGLPAIAEHMREAGQLDPIPNADDVLFACIESLCSRNAPGVIGIPAHVLDYANTTVLDFSSQIVSEVLLGASILWQEPRVVSRFMRYVWQRRAAHFDLHKPDGFSAFIAWFAFQYRRQFNLPSSLLPESAVTFLNQCLTSPALPVTVGMVLQARQSGSNRFDFATTDNLDRLFAISFDATNDLLKTGDVRLVPPYVSQYWLHRSFDTDPPLSNFEFVAWRALGAELHSVEDGSDEFSSRAKLWLTQVLLKDRPELDICLGSVKLKGSGEAWVGTVTPPADMLVVYSDPQKSGRFVEAERLADIALSDRNLSLRHIAFSQNRNSSVDEHRRNEALFRPWGRAVHLISLPLSAIPEAVVVHSHRFRSGDQIIGRVSTELNVSGTVDGLALSVLQELWTPTDFVTRALAKHTDSPVITMGLPVLPPIAYHDRPYFDLPRAGYVFLCCMEAGSDFERKNPLAAVHAFDLAFRGTDRNVMLVICDIDAYQASAPDTEHWNKLIEAAGANPRVRIIDRPLTSEEASSLLALCDCYVSLHRSESFGHATASAMRAGKPVIVTDWSGTKDYCDDGNSFPVSFSLTSVPDEIYRWKLPGEVYHWAVPDIAVAAGHMGTLQQHPELGTDRGARALEIIKSRYSTGAVRRRCRARLADLGGKVEREGSC